MLPYWEVQSNVRQQVKQSFGLQNVNAFRVISRSPTCMFDPAQIILKRRTASNLIDMYNVDWQSWYMTMHCSLSWDKDVLLVLLDAERLKDCLKFNVAPAKAKSNILLFFLTAILPHTHYVDFSICRFAFFNGSSLIHTYRCKQIKLIFINN